MIKEWILTDKATTLSIERKPKVKGKNFILYGGGDSLTSFTIAAGNAGPREKKYYILLEGFVLPRRSIDTDFLYSDIKPEELVISLYRQYGRDFIHKVKGNFIIIVMNPDEGFSIYTDRLGIKKVYYSYGIAGHRFIFSNRFQPLAENVNSRPNFDNIVVKSITHHYLGGLTFMKDIFYSTPASRILLQGEIKIESYWSCDQLLTLPQTEMTPLDVAEEYKTIVKRYIDFLRPSKVSVTLTGGLDSRTILAALLNLGIRPYTFTYGNPESADVTIARDISRKCNLLYQNHTAPLSAGWFSQLSEEIIDKGNSITQLHRAHRLYAIKKEVRVHPDTEMVMGGYMGGESIRNFYYDDLIVSPFVRDWINEPENKEELLNRTMEEKFLRSNAVKTDDIMAILENQRYLSSTPSWDETPHSTLQMREFLMTFLLLAGVHHSQDPNLFSHYIKHPVAVYLDIDFLQLIFSSQYNFLHAPANESSPSSGMSKLMKRVKGAELYCYFIDSFSPQLARIPFSKKGQYTAKEFVNDPTILLMMKRMKRHILNRTTYPANFAMEQWMEDYVKWQINRLESDPITPAIFDVDKAKQQLKSAEHSKSENYWRKYTDIMWTHLSFKKYSEL